MTVSRIRTRMYNVGFGDAFLLCLDHTRGTWRMLIDCGVHSSGGSRNKMPKIVDQIIADVTDAGGQPQIDVVVATHRHRDHVSGFASAKWDQVQVGEIWMPFTENPSDRMGRSIRDEQARKAARLHAHLLNLSVGNSSEARAARAAATIVENNLTNAPAMDCLHNGFAPPAARRRYFPNPRVERKTFGLPGLSEVAVHMLGPVRDRDVIARMDPTGDHWLALLDETGDDSVDTPAFAAKFRMPAHRIAAHYPDLYLTRSKRRELELDVSFDAIQAAASIEDAANNTSLVFVLDIDGTKLLFSGDAQWGLWEAILADERNHQHLADTRVYKVGHHGSHNGTHKRYVDMFMGTNATSLMSFHKVRRWPSIPNANLVSALDKGTRTLVRSDVTKSQRHVRWDRTLVAEHAIELTND